MSIKLRIIFGFLAAFALAAPGFSGTARAQGVQPAPMVAPGSFGLGFAFGEPTGVNAKLWRGQNLALVGGLAWSFANDGATQLYGDFIWHHFGLLDLQSGSMPLYVGAGARIQFESDARFGFRTVVGLDYLFARAPFDAFMELVPTFDVAPEGDFSLTAAVGFRYFFR